MNFRFGALQIACKISVIFIMANDSLSNVATESLSEFFRSHVTSAIINQHTTLSADAEFYVVNLLTHYSKTHNLYPVNAKGSAEDKALAIQLLEALSTNSAARIPILRKLGDEALYVAGFFGDSLFKKLVGVDYYIQMGHSAYASVSNLMSEEDKKSMRRLFEELANNFIPLVELLSEVADATHLSNDQNLLKLYERWMATGSERLRAILQQKGILANTSVRPGNPQ